MALSPALSSLLGESQLSRPQTVKKIWEYVKARDLQDPSDKRQAGPRTHVHDEQDFESELVRGR
jgi:chromatin remodeling complex protein RSC6